MLTSAMFFYIQHYRGVRTLPSLLEPNTPYSCYRVENNFLNGPPALVVGSLSRYRRTATNPHKQHRSPRL